MLFSKLFNYLNLFHRELLVVANTEQQLCLFQPIFIGHVYFWGSNFATRKLVPETGTSFLVYTSFLVLVSSMIFLDVCRGTTALCKIVPYRNSLTYLLTYLLME